MSHPIPLARIEAYLDELLPPEEMAEIEKSLRKDPALVARVREAIGRRDAGVHTLGAIWRRHRLTCLSREQLGSFLLGAMDEDLAQYAAFHLETIGCRYCLANLDDLKRQQAEAREKSVETRRRKYFQSSVGHLRRQE